MKTLTFFVLVKLIDHLHETGSNDELQYVITEGKRFKPIFTLQSMKEYGTKAVSFRRRAEDAKGD